MRHFSSGISAAILRRVWWFLLSVRKTIWLFYLFFQFYVQCIGLINKFFRRCTCCFESWTSLSELQKIVSVSYSKLCSCDRQKNSWFKVHNSFPPPLECWNALTWKKISQQKYESSFESTWSVGSARWQNFYLPTKKVMGSALTTSYF